VRNAALFYMAVTVFSLACGKDPTPPAPPPGPPGLRFLSGIGVTDTVDAILTAPMLVEVRDSSGQLAPVGTVVRFTSIFEPVQGAAPPVWLGALDSDVFLAYAAGEVDGGGRTGARVRFGSVARTALIAVSVPTLGLADTVSYSVVPGAAWQLRMASTDTALVIGRGSTLRASISDRHENVRNDPITWSVSGAGLSVTNQGALTAVSIGQFRVTGTSGVLADSIDVTVLPNGRIAGWKDGRIVTMDLDGGNLVELAQVSDDTYGPQPTWMPGTAEILYMNIDSGGRRTLRIVAGDGAVRDFLVAPPPEMTFQREAMPSRNGQFVAFTAWDRRCGDYCLYRARSDGTGAQLLGLAPGEGLIAHYPSPSPDGSKIAFGYNGLIRVYDVATRTISSWGVAGSRPQWSPSGDRIAYVSLGHLIALVNADGTKPRALTRIGRAYMYYPLTWSSDERWILARSFDGLDLVSAENGTWLPIVPLARVGWSSLR
jgi:hypothetical protein